MTMSGQQSLNVGPSQIYDAPQNHIIVLLITLSGIIYIHTWGDIINTPLICCSTKFSQEWVCSKVVAKHLIKSNPLICYKDTLFEHSNILRIFMGDISFNNWLNSMYD